MTFVDNEDNKFSRLITPANDKQDFALIFLSVSVFAAEENLSKGEKERKAKVEKFEFEGTEIRLNTNCYVCITMVRLVLVNFKTKLK